MATHLYDCSTTLDFTLETEIGNILTKNAALATCVSNDLCLSKGFEENLEESFRHLEALNATERPVGNAFLPRFSADTCIISLLKITKENDSDKTTYSAFTDCLRKLAKIVLSLKTWSHEAKMWTGSTGFEIGWSISARRTRFSGS